MKRIAAICLFALGIALPAGAAYFDTLFADPAHPRVSARMLYTSRFAPDGGIGDVALIYHRADPADSLWPKAFLDAGAPPISWTLLEIGAGGNLQTAFASAGVSVNVAPSVLGPLAAALKRAGGAAANFGALLVAPNGSGVNASLGWKTNVLQDGGFARFDRMRFPPRYGFGYCYQF
jgi:hypothetical protein